MAPRRTGRVSRSTSRSTGTTPSYPLTLELCATWSPRARPACATAGIGWRDPIAVYVTSAADCFLTFMAANWLGAIPALMNPNIPGDIAAEYIRRLRAVALITDAAHIARLDGEDIRHPGVRRRSTWAPPIRRARRRTTAITTDDPIAITHSSGTTGMPNAVVHTHASLFAATRRLRLSVPRAQGTERVLSALPAAAHGRHPDRQPGPVQPFRAAVPVPPGRCRRPDRLIEQWQPTGVFGFAVTWAELARFDLTERDLGSVAIWFNTGDCAHEAHIRPPRRGRQPQDRHPRRRRTASRARRFIDGLGSTEMGHAAFHISHRTDTDRYGRCVGRPHVFADVTLFDLATGDEVPNGVVGHCGLRSPTVMLGYWNDSANTYRNRFQRLLPHRRPDLPRRRRATTTTWTGPWTPSTSATARSSTPPCPRSASSRLPGRPRLHGDRGPRRGPGGRRRCCCSLARGADPDIDRTEDVRAALDPDGRRERSGR